MLDPIEQYFLMMGNLFSTRDLTGCAAAPTPAYTVTWKMEGARKGLGFWVPRTLIHTAEFF